MKILTGAKVAKLDKRHDGVCRHHRLTARRQDAETSRSSASISAVGIVGNVEDLGLEALGVKVDQRHIVTDGHGAHRRARPLRDRRCRRPALARPQGEPRGRDLRRDDRGAQARIRSTSASIPGCTYCQPQVASVGLTEARGQGRRATRCSVGRFPFIGNGKAIALGETEGLVKTVFDAKTGELLGAHMIGAEVTELIQGYRHRHDSGDHRGGADAHGLPASDAVGDDARKRCSTPMGGC